MKIDSKIISQRPAKSNFRKDVLTACLRCMLDT